MKLQILLALTFRTAAQSDETVLCALHQVLEIAKQDFDCLKKRLNRYTQFCQLIWLCWTDVWFLLGSGIMYAGKQLSSHVWVQS